MTAPFYDHAACAGDPDPEMWFRAPVDDEGRKSRATALTICARCPVRRECAQWAFDHAEEFGIWGGLDEIKRSKLLKLRTAS